MGKLPETTSNRFTASFSVVVLSALAVAAMCCFIFFMSDRPASESGAMSMGLARAIVSLAVPDYAALDAAAQLDLLEQIDHLVRKFAHFCEYALLGLLVANLASKLAGCVAAGLQQPTWRARPPLAAAGEELPQPPHVGSAIRPQARRRAQARAQARAGAEAPLSRKAGLIAWACATAYAATDELHQMLVPGRSCLAGDVLLDSSGVLVGVLAFWAVAKMARLRS